MRCSSWCAAPHPYAELAREQYDAVLRMLAEGYTSRHGPRGAYVHRDAVRRHAAWPARRQAGGGDLRRRDPRQRRLRGDARTAGREYRHRQRGLRGRESGRRRVSTGQCVVPDSAGRKRARARGGRARPAAEHPVLARRGAGAQRRAVASPSRGCVRRSTRGSAERPRRRSTPRSARSPIKPASIEEAARQIVEYLARARAALTVLPTQDTLVMERFFDESGGTQLVIHAPFGSRVNRAWGLALRKRFCRTFNFELQAAATEDAIVLSLTGSHSFALDEVWRYLHSNTAEHRADPGAARCAAVRRALALERDQRARAAALQRAGARSRRNCSACAAKICWRRCFPDQVGVPRKHGRRARTAASSAGRPDGRRLPARSDGHRAVARVCCGASNSGERATGHARLARALAARRRNSDGASPTRFSTTRRSKNAARRPCSTGAGPIPHRPTTWARSMRTQSTACATKRGRSRATPMKCTKR